MEQNKINAIIIAGLIVVGAGAWAGPMLTVQTANEYLQDLSNVEELSVALADNQNINFDQFGLGDLKDQIFLGAAVSFLPPPPAFVGPIVDLKAFTQQLIPADVTGESVPTDAANAFGAPVTLVEYIACAPSPTNNDDFDGPGNSGPATLEECQPATVDKLVVKAPATQDAVYRIQLGLCNAGDATPTVADGDNNPVNDLCSGGFPTTIILDVIFEISASHTHTIILEAGAINPGIGNVLMIRAADDTAGNQNVFAWVGIKRVGNEGAIEFINPAQFGGTAPNTCVEFTIRQSNGVTAIQGATVQLQILGPPGIPPFSDVKITDVNGKAKFDPIPEGFAIVDLFVTNKPPFFLDRPVFNANEESADAPNNFDTAGTDNCNETTFNLPV